jgi:hypothetical protein
VEAPDDRRRVFGPRERMAVHLHADNAFRGELGEGATGGVLVEVPSSDERGVRADHEDGDHLAAWLVAPGPPHRDEEKEPEGNLDERGRHR